MLSSQLKLQSISKYLAMWFVTVTTIRLQLVSTMQDCKMQESLFSFYFCMSLQLYAMIESSQVGAEN